MTGFVDTQDNRKDFKEKFAGSDAGPFVGVVKFTNDPTFQGRLGVNIPDITKTNDPIKALECEDGIYVRIPFAINFSPSRAYSDWKSNKAYSDPSKLYIYV